MGKFICCREGCADNAANVQLRADSSWRSADGMHLKHGCYDNSLIMIKIGVGYLMYTEVFSPNSATTQFNRAATQVKNDPRCIELLGDGNEIRAFGEPTSNKWARAGPIAHHTRKDPNGTEHLIMHFNVRTCWKIWLGLY